MKKLFIQSLIIIIAVLPMLSAIAVRAETVGDYDGDGKTDIFVIRRRNGYINWFILGSKDNKFSATQWGSDPTEGRIADLPLLGDFDGDRKADIGVFRRAFTTPATVPNYFFILRSTDNTLIAVQWGYNADEEISQDYDGDGKTDIAIARSEPANGLVWYILGSRAGFLSYTIRNGYTPIRGDYDGDGKADCASVGIVDNFSDAPLYFFIRKSSTGQIERTQFGSAPSAFAVPGDYDGDGKTDIAVWFGKNKSPSGFWFWLRSSDGNWGRVRIGSGFTNGDYAVPGDYDGDGKTDPAIFRTGDESSAQAYFYILGSRSGFYGVPWGINYLDGAPLFLQAQ